MDRTELVNGRYIKNKVEILEKAKLRRIKIKTGVLTHYGNGKCACVWCGFEDIRALTIDHMYGNGAEHRNNNDIRGDRIYYWLIKNNYPEGYQTLCMNCQLIKRYKNKEYHQMVKYS